MRPVLYGAVHPITCVTRGGDRGGRQRVDVVGPVCESGDCFLHDWPLGRVAPGDVLAIWVAGAYGMSQSSNYNARFRSAEVLVEGSRYRVVRKRETLDDLVRGQIF
jgi:diaminopimelate decarboxylase